MNPLIIEAVIIAVISIWAIWRKGLAGVPLILGLWFFYGACILLYHWFPPTPGQIALAFFLAGIAIALLIWGVYNIWLNFVTSGRLLTKKFAIEKVGDKELYIALEARPNYGVMYGLIPWDDRGADILHQFLNNEVWARGLKVTHFQAEHAEVGGLHCAFILGILRPKTIIDRILY
ncbi:MAG: hypothetical protein DRP01_01895 [Archaeoglobales archaeon]|nr:MAG: hypothetical protein DRP01_01895 [Archaeoglobales archaeon]